MRLGKKLLALLLAATMVLPSQMTVKANICGGLEPEDLYQPEADEVIQDPALHWAVRAAMNSIQGGVKLTASMVGNTSVKNISYEMCAHPEDFETDAWSGKQYWIESLEGLQYATSATMIDIAYTSSVEGKSIKDLTPIANLTQLDTLILKQDGISDISSIEKLVNLTTLDISANRNISNVSAIRNMTKLKSLNASFNAITSVDALSNLTSLEYVSLSDNQITSLPDLSKLTNVYFFDASNNNLSDVSEIAKMTNLQQLSLSKNPNITDVRPLVALTKLQKDATTLPDNSKKEDLFAAIEVNKKLELFNISRMTEADLTNVQAALDAYDALTAEQKTYMETARVEAARSNMVKVRNGEEPVYYPEYDKGEVKEPVWDRLEISVVDKYGNPMPGVSFVKTGRDSEETYATLQTNEYGKLVLKHSPTDVWRIGEIVVTPAGNEYVATPTEITYTVEIGNTTKTVNGQPATGMEVLKFVLVSTSEFVDKQELEQAISDAGKIEEAYKYTEESYQKFQKALEEAKTLLENVDALQTDVDQAVLVLNNAMNSLEKAKVLTELKLVVKDENGNLFHRAFKFQVRVPDTHAEAWNDYSDAETAIAYLKTSPGWAEGKIWEILPCYEEAYEMESIKVTIGVTESGQRYFKTVDGKAVDIDFEKTVVVKYLPEKADGARKPDSTVLEKVLAEANEVQLSMYTPSTAEELEKAIQDAEAALAKKDAIQEDYNAAIADLEKAQEKLAKVADKSKLKTQLDMYYSESMYTTVSWSAYQQELQKAKEVYNDGNATQEQVDLAEKNLKKTSANLVLRANKTELSEKLTEVKGLKSENYQSGFEALEAAIAEAEQVYNDVDAGQDKVDAQVEALNSAMEQLVKKPAEVDYTCYPAMFKAKVTDQMGIAMSGVKFEAVVDGKAETTTLTSDENGIITYYLYGNRGKTVHIQLADERYTTTDKHFFEVIGTYDWLVTMKTIDGQPYAEGTKLTYVLKIAGGETPTPDTEPTEQVLCDENTFRAKVVDESGKAVDGVAFFFQREGSENESITCKNGVIERNVGKYEVSVRFTVSLKEGQEAGEGKVWTCEETHAFKQGGDWINGAKLTEVDGASLADAKEIVFTLKKVNGNIPAEVNKKELDDELFFAKSYEGKSDNYTKESYQNFEKALSEAKSVFADEEATQEQVDEATENLKKARENLKEAEKVPVCDKSTIRVRILDESGNVVTTAVPFKVGYSTQNSRNGVIEYTISTADMGTEEIVISLKDGSVVIGEKTYVVEPEYHTFTLREVAGDVYLSAIDGETLENTKEVKFVLKEKEEEVVDKTELKQLVSDLGELKQGNYTKNSYDALKSALTAAKLVCDNEAATQEEVANALIMLQKAKNELKEVQGMRVLEIPVLDAEGNAAPDNTKFVRYDVKYWVEHSSYVRDGKLTWKLGAYESGDYEIYLPDNSAYIATPGIIKVHVGNEDGTPVIETINGQPIDKVSPKFVISARGTDTSDILTFRAIVKDAEGNLLEGVKFHVKYGDPEEIVSDVNGVIEYTVSAWDTDTTMTVSLKEGQDWVCEKEVTFSVITDPDDTSRGIIGAIDGDPLNENVKIVFELAKPSQTPEQKPDENPEQKPDETPEQKPEDKPNQKPDEGKKPSSTKDNTVQTGDGNQLSLYIGAAVVALGIALVMIFQRKKVTERK